jgi:ABC-2 type transport system ATP-binding protein
MSSKIETEYVISTQGLTKEYKGATVLNDLDLNVEKNSIFGFLGPNGAGKTTTMKLLCGLIKPSRGGGTVFGYDIQSSSIPIRSRVGYLAQDPLYPKYMTAREVLQYTAKFYFKGPKQAIEERTENMINLVGLEDKADRPIKGFSGGERQRLGIAQANINFPDLLILDEPAAALDPIGRRDVLEIMERLRKYATIFYSTHILDDVERVSDKVAILNKGDLIAQGSIKELFATKEGSTFTVKIEGDGDKTQNRISDQSWVSEIETIQEKDCITLHVNVSDVKQAKSKLLRLILSDESIEVVEFGQKEYDLEEIFMELVGSDNSGTK